MEKETGQILLHSSEKKSKQSRKFFFVFFNKRSDSTMYISQPFISESIFLHEMMVRGS